MKGKKDEKEIKLRDSRGDRRRFERMRQDKENNGFGELN